MQLSGNISIEKLNGIFTFFFDGEKIFLTKKSYILEPEEDMHLSFFDKYEFDYLNGKTTLGGDIYFYNVKLVQRDFFENEYFGYCQNVLIPKTMNSFYKEFDSIRFKGDVVNKFYPPITAIDHDPFTTIYRLDEDGRKIIKIKMFDEYTIKRTIELEGTRIEFVLSIEVKISNKETNNILDLNAYIELVFENKRPIVEVSRWFKIIHSIFQFIFNRQEISFDDITVVNTEKSEPTVFSSYIPLSNKESIDSKINLGECIRYDYIIDNIDKFLVIMDELKINMYHLPESTEDHKYLTPHKYVFTASSFEYEYNLSRISNFDTNICEIKKRLIDVLVSIDEENKGVNAEIRKLSKSFTNLVENYDKSLEIKISKSLDINDKVLARIKEKVKRNYFHEMSNTDIGINFARARNKNAHGSILNYEKNEIAAFLIVRALVYMMILKRCYLSDATIVHILDIHF